MVRQVGGLNLGVSVLNVLHDGSVDEDVLFDGLHEKASLVPQLRDTVENVDVRRTVVNLSNETVDGDEGASPTDPS